MIKKPKRRVLGRKLTAKSVPIDSVLEQFNCDCIEYDIDLPVTSFNYKRFSRLTGIKVGERWSTVLPSRDPESAYHVHFGGLIQNKRVRMTLEYWNGTVTPSADEIEPFSETISKWIGSFVKEPTVRATVAARFRKPVAHWRSRFNLPFKVTMAGREVVIDGLSLELPKNPYRVLFAMLTTMGEELFVTAHAVRPIDFAAFDIVNDVVDFNESLDMFLEHLP